MVKITKTSSKKRIIKTDDTFNTIMFVALVPDAEDSNGDIISEEEITSTAHEFMINLQDKSVDVDHDEDDVVEDAVFVESYITPIDIELENGETIPKWSWVVWIKFEDDIYEKFVDGDFVWISIGGEGYRVDV